MRKSAVIGTALLGVLAFSKNKALGLALVLVALAIAFSAVPVKATADQVINVGTVVAHTSGSPCYVAPMDPISGVAGRWTQVDQFHYSFNIHYASYSNFYFTYWWQLYAPGSVDGAESTLQLYDNTNHFLGSQSAWTDQNVATGQFTTGAQSTVGHGNYAVNLRGHAWPGFPSPWDNCDTSQIAFLLVDT